MKKTVNGLTTLYFYDIDGNLIETRKSDGSPVSNYVYRDDQRLALLEKEDRGVCNNDINWDGVIDFYDVADLRIDFGSTACFDVPCLGDLDDDGDVDGVDGAALLATLGISDCPLPQEGIYYFHNNHLGAPLLMTDQTGTVVWQADYDPFGTATVAPASTLVNNFRLPGQYFDEETGLHYNWHRYYDPGTGRYLTPDPIGLRGGLNLYLYSEADPINGSDILGLWSIGGGAYWGGGGDASYTSTTCCKNGKKVTIKYFTFCGGVGVGGKLGGATIPVSFNKGWRGTSTYGNTCPKTGDVYFAQQATLAFAGGATGTAQAGNRGAAAEATGTFGFGASLEALKICAIIVGDEEETSECCEQKGNRFTDGLWQ